MLEVSTCTLQLPTPPSPKQQAAADQQQQQQFGGSFVGDHAAGCFPTSATDDGCFMVDDADSLLLDYIDFSTCDVVPFFDADGDVLPDLEADPTELLAEFPSSPEPEADYYDNPAACRASPPAPAVEDPPDVHKLQDDLLPQQPPPPMMTIVLEDKKAADEEKPWLLEATNNKEEEEEKDPPEAVTTSATAAAADQAEEDYSTTTGNGAADTSKSSSAASAEGNHHSHSKKKPAAAAGNNSSHAGKRKVDWTPELHRRFVQAVEQLGIDKAVPSRILEIMGIQCLTRHNIASHLQKYRSHRKHLMAREAEAASWAQKRQMYAGAAGTAAPARKLAVDVSSAPAVPRPWVVPTIGFPPPPAAAPFCRPLHVWGHPPHTGGAAAVEAAAGAPPTTTTMLLPLPVWPRHLLAPPPRPTVDPAAYWHQHYSAARKWGPPQPAAAVTQGTPVPVPVPVPVPTPMPRFPVPHPIPMYTPPPPPPPPQQQQQQQQQSSSKLAELQLQLDAHPSKESIDAAIGDVLVKPWLPLPLGLKPPSVDSVMSELHKQGIPKVPPAATD